VFILGVPIFDTTLVTLSRARRGLVPFASPGKDHTSHRLSNLGLGHKGAVLALYAAGAVSGGLSLVLSGVSSTAGGVIVAIAVVFAGAGIVALERVEFERQSRS
jgi:UDP-GlcNAc:undecaprenyl-phosphate GlcNAc-1-phosphate transferase